MKNLLMFLGAIILIVLTTTYSILTSALIIDCYWDWFLIPHFSYFTDITFVQAICLSFIFILFKRKTVDDIKDEYKDKTKYWSGFIILPWMILLVGYIVNLIIN